jgi:hypothetical protein
MRAGPKGQITVEPLNFTGWPADRAARRERFITEYLIIPRGHGAGEPFLLREFQSKIISGAFALVFAPGWYPCHGRTAKPCWPLRWR